ncbi:Lsr2 family protein [Nocardioides mangrovicus]|uniref:Lsr2 family protein n=1 Tax=Nocardioides mangrovicus TaxID=2478913 RepID=A0A3L8P512_9ACTN|nr:Lsr2 family protein [Nocardioides mangrovicus]RLV50466.1 Lsr2 family protein [Nocardioides mangrovicus]
MAQKVNIVLVDDIDASEADETVAFALDGKDYLIDLNTKNADALRDALALYVGHARSAGSKRAGGGRRSAAAARTSAGDAGEIREWARAQGYEVSERGRISSEVRDAYASAH